MASAITESAGRYLRALRDARDLPGEPRVRIVRRAGQLGMSFLEAPRKSDRLVDLAGFHVYVARNLAGSLRQRVIDVRVSDGRSHLVLRRLGGG